MYAQDCNNPIAGKSAVVDEITTGLACLLCGNAATQNVIDGDLTNYVTVTNLATLPGTTSLLSVKDVQLNYAGGRRTGFVIQPVSGVLSASILSNFRIRTYLDNVLQETAIFGGGGGLNIGLLGGSNDLQRLDFVTTLPFDEVELVVTGAVTGLNTIRIYYAYEEMANGCDYNCVTPITMPNYDPDPTASSPLVILGGFSNTDNVVDGNTGNFASRTFTVGLGTSAYLEVNIGQTITAGNEVGFAIQRTGLLDAILGLDLSVLQNITITTYSGATQQESFTADQAAVSVGLLNSSDVNLISFRTTANFNRVRVTVGSLADVLITYRVYYAFIRADSDNDGFPNCVDKCAGNDNLDADGDGTPDACDPACTVNAGLDISVCPPATTAQLTPAVAGQTWSAIPGNPSSATINNAGVVSGLSSEGTYFFRLSDAVCADTVAIQYEASAIDYTCNDPISGFGAVIGNGGLVNGVCLLCSNPLATNVIDGDLSNYVEYNALLSLLATTTLVAVEDTIQTYPAGTRTGFVVSTSGGLLDASVLSAFQIRTYLNGTLQETATTAGNVLGASAVAGAGNRQRISFVTMEEFDEVELLVGNVAGVLTSIRVYYAFEENAASCPDSGSELSCLEILNASSIYCGMIDYQRTGFSGAACALCELESLGHLVDDNTTNAATLTLTAGLLTDATVAVKTRQTIPAGYETGFAITGSAQLLNADVLGGLRLTTYLNGIQRETILATSPLLNATLLGDGSSIGLLSFTTMFSFDEVQLTVQAPVSANLLSSLNIYYAFVRRDTDGDGTPDCYDKCCSGNDNLDQDGNGVPDACDAYAVAQDDAANAYTNTATNIDVLDNDNFGADGPGSFTIFSPPSNGTATILDGGTPADPSDDYIIYTSNAGFTGTDVFYYRICDSNNSCDEAAVTVNVTDPTPLAQNDINNTLLNTPVSGNVVTNDVDPNGLALTVNTIPVAAPMNGMLVLNSDGTYTYTPNANFEGTDQFTYQVCNTLGFCDNAIVNINVFDNPNGNDAPVAHNDLAETLAGVTVGGNVLNNDIDPDGNQLTVNTTPVTSPANGTLSLNADGSFTYMPNEGFTGTDQFTYEVCDPGNLCDQATVTITVSPDANGNANNPPFAQDDADHGFANTPISGNVVLNDSEPNGQALTVNTSPLVPPMNGTLLLNSNGTYTYTPNVDFIGTDQFVYQVCDPNNACDMATVYLTVEADERAPIAQDDINNTLVNTPVNGNVRTNDVDPNGITLTVNTTPVNAPTNGMVALNSDGTYTYTPNTNFEGTDQFTYRVCDVEGLCDIATVTINVFDNVIGNEPPVAHNDIAETQTDVPVNGNVLNNDVDPDGSPLMVNTMPVAGGEPMNGSVIINSNGTFTYTPNMGFVGTDQFTYRVCDASNACDEATVFITVNPDNNGTTNDPPFAQDDAYRTTLNTMTGGNVLNNDSDPNGNALTADVVMNPSNGTLVLNPDGTFTYTPNNGFIGTDQFIYQACDPSDACDQATVYITTTADLGNPDLTVGVITQSPGIAKGGSSAVTYNLTNTGVAPTTGSTIQFRIFKVSNFGTLTLTTVPLGWTVTEDNAVYYLTSTAIINTGFENRIIFEASFTHDGDNEVAIIDFIGTIQGGSGGEVNTNNNTDSDKILVNQ